MATRTTTTRTIRMGGAPTSYIWEIVCLRICFDRYKKYRLSLGLAQKKVCVRGFIYKASTRHIEGKRYEK